MVNAVIIVIMYYLSKLENKAKNQNSQNKLPRVHAHKHPTAPWTVPAGTVVGIVQSLGTGCYGQLNKVNAIAELDLCHY